MYLNSLDNLKVQYFVCHTIFSVCSHFIFVNGDLSNVLPCGKLVYSK